MRIPFPIFFWKVKPFGEIAAMDLGDSPVVGRCFRFISCVLREYFPSFFFQDVVGLLLNFSFGEAEGGVDDGIVGDASDKQIIEKRD